MRAVCGCAFVVFVCAVARPVALGAQAPRTEVMPLLAISPPPTDVCTRPHGVAPGDRRAMKHDRALVFGGRVGGSWGRRTGFEVSFGYTPSGTAVVYTDPSDAETRTTPDAGVFLASLRFLVGVGPSGGPVSWSLMLGPSVLSHGGAAYDSLALHEGTTDIGALLGLSTRIKLGRSVALRLDVEDNLYMGMFSDTAGVRSDRKFQHDLVVSLGVAIPFGGPPSTGPTPGEGIRRQDR